MYTGSIKYVLLFLIILVITISQPAIGKNIPLNKSLVGVKKLSAYHAKDLATVQSVPDLMEPYTLLVNENQFIYRYISSLAISPDFTNDRTIFAGINNGGVFKSTDGGNTWIAMNNGLDNLWIKTLEISPTHRIDKTIFAGVNTSRSADGVFKSVDGGQSWIQFNNSPGSVQDFAISPNFSMDQTIFLGSNGQSVMKSTDGGETWHQKSAGHSQIWTLDLSPDYSTDQTIFAGATDGIHKSNDGGESWTWVYGETSTTLDYQTGSLTISPNFASDSTVFAGTYLGLIRTTDGGSSWIFVLPLAIGQIVFSPAYYSDQTVFVAAAGGVFKSTDGGDSWIEINEGLTNLSIEDVTLSPAYPTETILFGGTHHGVFRCENETTWMPINDGLLLTEGIEQLTNSVFQMDAVPTMAIDSSGSVHIAWEGTYALETSPDGITSDAFYMNNRSGSFEPLQKISVPFGYYSISVSLAIDLDYYAHIAFRRGNSRSNESDDALYYVTNRETSFENPILIKQGISGAGGLPWHPSIAVDQSRNAHIAFVGLYTNYIWYTNNVTGSFMTPIEIPEPERYSSGLPSLAIDQAGHAHIAYLGESPGSSFGDVFYVNNLNDTFNPGINVSRESNSEDRPQIALDSFEIPHIVYECSGGPIRYTFMESDTFSAPIPLGHADDDSRPSIAIDKSNFIHISHVQGKEYASNVQGFFNNQQLLGVDAGLNVGSRCIGISPENIVHVVFAMPGSRIVGDSNYELYHISFPIEIITPSITIGDTTVYEGDEGTTIAKLPVLLSVSSAQTVTVDYFSSDGTAIAGSDYISSSGTLSFSSGSISDTIFVLVIGDTLEEPFESFFINLINPVYATIADNQAQCYIKNDDGTPDALIWMPPGVGDPTSDRKTSEQGINEAETKISEQENRSDLALKAALEANGKSVLIVSDITSVNLFPFKAVLAVLGAYPDNYRVPADGPEALAIENFILGGGNMYLEGNDVWYWDPKFGGHDFGPLFSIRGVSSSGGNFGTILGSNFVAGMDFLYDGSTSSNDVIAPLGPAFVIHSNQSPAFDCGVAYDQGAYKTIGVSHQFGCLIDGATTKDQLMGAYLNFFGLMGFDITGLVRYYSNDEPADSVLVKANDLYSDTTDNTGNYELLDLPEYNYTVRPEKENDINGAISAYDAAWILQYGVGLRTFTPYQMLAGDVSGNGSVTAYDAAKILQFGVGLINQFPVMEDNTHFWRFVPADFPINDTNWVEAPDSIAYTPLNSDTTDNYLGIIYGDVSGNWHPSESASVASGKQLSKTVTIRLADVYGETGDKIILPVSIDNNSEVIALSFSLGFDAKVLKALTVSTTELTKDWQIAHHIKGALMRVALAGTTPIAAPGTILNLEFEVLKNDLTAISSPVNISDVLINEGTIAALMQAANFNQGSSLPKEYALFQNYPNPFNAQTVIKYQIPEAGRVMLKIYNMLGQEVRTLVDGEKKAGFYRINWDGKDDEGTRLSSGIYLYQIQAGNFVRVKKILFVM